MVREMDEWEWIEGEGEKRPSLTMTKRPPSPVSSSACSYISSSGGYTRLDKFVVHIPGFLGFHIGRIVEVDRIIDIVICQRRRARAGTSADLSFVPLTTSPSGPINEALCCRRRWSLITIP